MTKETWLNTKEIAERLNIHVETVRRWLRSGMLRGVLVGGKSGYRIREHDLDRFLKSREKSGRKE